MHKKWCIFLSVVLIITFSFVSGCKSSSETTTGTTTTPSGTYNDISNQISSINASLPSSLANILSAITSIEAAETEGTVSETETSSLEGQIGAKFSSWIIETVDGIDPTKPESLKDFFDLQAVQRTSEYDDNVDSDTKQYKEEQMADKFNEWVRNRVDEIDPADEGALKDMFDLQVIQRTGKYDNLATEDTHEYKEEQMGEKLNDWVRNRMNEIDPTDPDSLKFFFWMQTIQASEKYDEFATPETHEWKESEMKRKFNEWVENRVNDLDPDDPNFLEELEKLLVIQRSDKYDKFIATLMHEWKEQTLKEKMDQYTENLVNKLNPLSPTFWEDLSKLIELQRSDVFKDVAAKGTKDYKLASLIGLLTKPLGPPPTVTGVYPQFGQTGVSLDQSILIVFDQPMELETLGTAITVSPETLFAAKLRLEENFIILLQPLEPLIENATYSVTVNQDALSFAGIPLFETYESTFTTKEAGAAPNVTRISPRDGAVGDKVGQPIILEFDQVMSTTSVEASLGISPSFDYSILWTDDTTATIQSHAPLDANTKYTVTLNTNAKSADGIPLANELEFSFIPTLMNSPALLGTMPYSGQGNIPSNHPIQIVFDRSMDTQSVEDLLDISPNLEYTTNWYDADMVLEIVPLATLPANTTFTITIGAGVLSSFGLPLAEYYTFTFSTES
ncbi:Ig-like domain-containing protein [Chloroflexota bacterium]